jgi:D-glycero-D-manno-heptose 1,7-bisphosphate phosphatase
LSSGIALAGAYYCYHHPQGVIPAYSCNCACRKPGIESLVTAQTTYGLNLNDCWMIGDQDTDVYCGQRAGCHTILLDYPPSTNKRGRSQPDALCQDIHQAATLILPVKS